MKVMVLGRHPVVMRAVLEQLALHGYEAVGCFGDREAERLLVSESFDVVALGGALVESTGLHIRRTIASCCPLTQVIEIESPQALIPGLRQLTH